MKHECDHKETIKDIQTDVKSILQRVSVLEAVSEQRGRSAGIFWGSLMGILANLIMEYFKGKGS